MAAANVGESAVAHERLQEMRDFYAFYAQELPQIIKRFEQWRSAHGRDQPSDDEG